jgi:hypothetical protein
MFDAKFKLAAASLIRAAMVEDFDTAELIISQHDPYELTRAMAVISAQGWTITNGYNMARAVESLDVLASVFAEEVGVDRREPAPVSLRLAIASCPRWLLARCCAGSHMTRTQ